jgi:hypothetical protein
VTEAAAYTSSPFVGSIEPITASDDEIRAALEDAEVPPLLPALAYLTGDMGLLLDHLRPNALMIGSACRRAGFPKNNSPKRANSRS